MTSKFDLVPPEFLVIPPSHPDDAGQQQEVEPPRLLGAAIDLHREQEHVSGKEDPNTKQDFVELSLESNSEGTSDLLRSPAGPDGQRRRNRTDTMIFSEAINIAEDLAKAQTEGELEGPMSSVEVSPIEEVTEIPLVSEVIPSAGDAAPVSSDSSLEFTDHIPTDEVEEIPLPSVTDSEPAVLEDPGAESSDEEVVPEEEIPDPGVTESPVLPENPVSGPPSAATTEPSPSDADPDEKKPEPADIPEPPHSIPETSEPPAEVEITPTTMDEDEDEDVDSDEEEPASASGLPDLEVKDDSDNDNDDGDGSQPANKPEVEA